MCEVTRTTLHAFQTVLQSLPPSKRAGQRVRVDTPLRFERHCHHSHGQCLVQLALFDEFDEHSENSADMLGVKALFSHNFEKTLNF